MKMRSFFRMGVLLTAICLTAAGCGKDDKTPEQLPDPLDTTTEYYLVGVVSSAEGVVKGAEVKITDDIKATTDAQGKYNLTLSKTGDYTVTVKASKLEDFNTKVNIASSAKNRSTLTLNVKMSKVVEYTVEAGRPDTITLEKLRVMAQNGVDRISINPQTLNNSVLKAIGRRHTAEDFLDAWKLSEEFHFDRNVDLIAGLPEDTFESFRSTIEQVLALHPENITVHTLTVKHASTLKEEGPQKRTAMEMVEYSRHLLEEAGYQPYYLYRQKGTVEALENVGYTLPGKACKYNVYIMDDGHTIISAGAGGVTKLVPNGPQRITRSFNYKYPYEYINRFQTVLERKEVLPLWRLNDTE